MKYQFVYLNVATVCLNELDSVCLNGRAGQGKPRGSLKYQFVYLKSVCLNVVTVQLQLQVQVQVQQLVHYTTPHFPAPHYTTPTTTYNYTYTYSYIYRNTTLQYAIPHRTTLHHTTLQLQLQLQRQLQQLQITTTTATTNCNHNYR